LVAEMQHRSECRGPLVGFNEAATIGRGDASMQKVT